MRVIGVLQARMTSMRLPGKILASVAGEPMLRIIATRLQGAPIDELWLATSDRESDDATERAGHDLGMRVFRGSEDDVMSRFAAIVRDQPTDWVVRLTADNPFVDAPAVRVLLDAALVASTTVAVISEGETRRTPLGYMPEIARGGAILAADREVPSGSYHRAHVLTWLYERGQFAPVALPKSWPHRPQWRWTVDTAADLRMANEAFALIRQQSLALGYEGVCTLLDAHPEITEINIDVPQKAVEAS
jgi:spore coat polysaccharide biosynthesis protein SpsF